MGGGGDGGSIPPWAGDGWRGIVKRFEEEYRTGRLCSSQFKQKLVTSYLLLEKRNRGTSYCHTYTVTMPPQQPLLQPQHAEPFIEYLGHFPLTTNSVIGLYLLHFLWSSSLTHFLLYSEEMIKRLAAFLIYTVQKIFLAHSQFALNVSIIKATESRQIYTY